MGILAYEANLPMDITLSNVYISFSKEVIYVVPSIDSNIYNINTHYKVYKNESKQPDTNIRVPIFIHVDDITKGIYTLLYDELKQIYPNSVDC